MGIELIQLQQRDAVIGLNASFGNEQSQSFSAQLANTPGVFTSVNLVNSSVTQRMVTLEAGSRGRKPAGRKVFKSS